MVVKNEIRKEISAPLEARKDEIYKIVKTKGELLTIKGEITGEELNVSMKDLLKRLDEKRVEFIKKG